MYRQFLKKVVFHVFDSYLTSFREHASDNSEVNGETEVFLFFSRIIFYQGNFHCIVYQKLRNQIYVPFKVSYFKYTLHFRYHISNMPLHPISEIGLILYKTDLSGSITYLLSNSFSCCVLELLVLQLAFSLFPKFCLSLLGFFSSWSRVFLKLSIFVFFNHQDFGL